MKKARESNIFFVYICYKAEAYAMTEETSRETLFAHVLPLSATRTSPSFTEETSFEVRIL